jgi:hypothetical protein
MSDYRGGWLPLDRHYETLRLDMRALFHDLGVAA